MVRVYFWPILKPLFSYIPNAKKCLFPNFWRKVPNFKLKKKVKRIIIVLLELQSTDTYTKVPAPSGLIDKRQLR